MIQLPRQVEYALMVLAVMQDAPDDHLFSARALAAELRIPFDVTAKAMQGMNRAGILNATQGKKGGYRINRNLTSVTFDALIEAMGYPTALTSCLHHGVQCKHEKRCKIRTSIARLDQRVRNLFKDVTVLELITP